MYVAAFQFYFHFYFRLYFKTFYSNFIFFNFISSYYFYRVESFIIISLFPFIHLHPPWTMIR